MIFSGSDFRFLQPAEQEAKVVEHLERAIEQLRAMPDAKQALAVDLLLDIAEAASENVYELSEEEAQAYDAGIADLDNGRVASEAEVERVFSKYQK
jgi:predicted transcriptional regulator